MDARARALRLLSLLSSRPWWTSAELTNRLEVTDRTLRRDVARLRDLGYPINATTGPAARYELGAGGRMPPLVLDDDEAIAVTIALRSATGLASQSMGDAALSALTKLDQVLPVSLRERVDALRAVTVSGPSRRGPELASDTLTTLALGCRRSERLRFTYRTGDGVTSERHVDPFRLVPLARRWYLVAFDRDRNDWRTFRVDRVSEARLTGALFTLTDPLPDAFALVAEGVAVRVYGEQATVRIHLPPHDAVRLVPPDIGMQVEADDNGTVFVIGGDMDWIARYLVSLECTFEVVEPDALRTELRALARRVLRDHQPAARARRPSSASGRTEL